MEAQTMEPTEELVTYAMAEEVLLSSKNPRMKAQYAEGVINPIVLADAVGCRPQMIYNYIRKGAIKTLAAGVSTNSTQKMTIEWRVATLWAQQYLNRKAVAQAKIESELRGET